MRKTIFIDTETTGIDPNQHCIWQLAGVVDVDGEVKDKFNYKMSPMEGAEIDDEALEIGGITVEDLNEFDPPDTCFEHFKTLIEKHVDKFSKVDKFYVGGYNVGFDIDFVGNFFRAYCGDKYGFGSYTNWKKVDPIPVLHWLDYMGIFKLQNYKLATVCQAFGVELKAHDAHSDVMAARELIKRIEEKYSKIGILYQEHLKRGQNEN